MTTTTRTTAADAYTQRAEQIAQHLADLQHLLAEHAKCAAAQPRNWGFAGDLDSVEQHLAEAVRMLGGNE